MRIKYESTKCPDLTKVMSKDESRPVLCCAYLDVDRAVLEATDTYRLVSVPVEVEEGDVSGLVPGEAVAAYTKAQDKSKADWDRPSLKCGDRVELHGQNATAGDYSQSWERPAGTFPNVQQLIPDEHRRSGFRVGFDAKLLAELAKGLGNGRVDHVELQFVQTSDSVEEGEGVGLFPSALKPILVTSRSNPDAVGLLMPVRLS